MKRKLLVFHPALAPYRVDFFNALADRFDLHLVLLGRNLQEQSFDQCKLISRLRCRVSYLLRGIVFRSRYIRTGAVRLVRAEHPDVVLSYEYSLITLVLVVYRFVSGSWFKLYTMTDDNVELFGKCRGIRSILRRFVLRSIDGCIVIDESVKHFMDQTAGRHSLDVVTVPIVYDERYFRHEEDALFTQAAAWRMAHLKSNEKAIFFVGRLEPVKNIMWLIDVAMSSGWPAGCRLFIVGEGSMAAALHSKAATHDRDRHVSFLGRKEGRDLHLCFAAADALVLCSVSESFGSVVSEALHWGAPAYVSNHVGAKTLIRPDKNGAVFPLDDGAALCSHMQKISMSTKNWRPKRPSLMPVQLADAVAKFNP